MYICLNFIDNLKKDFIHQKVFMSMTLRKKFKSKHKVQIRLKIFVCFGHLINNSKKTILVLLREKKISSKLNKIVWYFAFYDRTKRVIMRLEFPIKHLFLKWNFNIFVMIFIGFADIGIHNILFSLSILHYIKSGILVEVEYFET